MFGNPVILIVLSLLAVLVVIYALSRVVEFGLRWGARDFRARGQRNAEE